MQSPQPMIIIIKWRRDLEALFLPATDHDQMDKRYGWGTDFLLFLANHDYSSVMECYAIKLLFIGPCLCWTGHYHIHRPLLEDWGTSGIMLEQTGTCSMKLDKQTQDDKPLESLYEG